MTKTEATAEIFLTALKGLSKTERDIVLVRIAKDKEFSDDLRDLMLISKRKNDSSRPFRDYLKERNKSNEKA